MIRDPTELEYSIMSLNSFIFDFSMTRTIIFSRSKGCGKGEANRAEKQVGDSHVLSEEGILKPRMTNS